MEANKSVPQFKEITAIAGANLLHVVVGNVDKKIQWTNLVGQIDTDLQISSTFSDIDTSLTVLGGSITTLDGNVVKLTGNQSINGVKTFVLSPTVPNPTNGTDAANKQWVLSQITGGISGLTTGVYPVATSATTIGNGRISQDTTSLTIPSPDGNTVFLISNSEINLEKTFSSGLARLHLDGIESVLNWADSTGTKYGRFAVDEYKSEAYHTLQISLSAPEIVVNRLTAGTVPYLDGAKTLRSSNAGSDGQIFKKVAGVPTWSNMPTITTYTAGNGIDLGGSVISLTPLTTSWDTGKGVIIGDDTTAIQINALNGIDIVSDGDGIRINSETRAIYGNGGNFGGYFESEAGYALGINGKIKWDNIPDSSHGFSAVYDKDLQELILQEIVSGGAAYNYITLDQDDVAIDLHGYTDHPLANGIRMDIEGLGVSILSGDQGINSYGENIGGKFSSPNMAAIFEGGLLWTAPGVTLTDNQFVSSDKDGVLTRKSLSNFTLPKFTYSATSAPSADANIATSKIAGNTMVAAGDQVAIELVCVVAAGAAVDLDIGFKLNGVDMKRYNKGVATAVTTVFLKVILQRRSTNRIDLTLEYTAYQPTTGAVAFFGETITDSSTSYDFTTDIPIALYANQLIAARVITGFLGKAVYNKAA